MATVLLSSPIINDRTGEADPNIITDPKWIRKSEDYSMLSLLLSLGSYLYRNPLLGSVPRSFFDPTSDEGPVKQIRLLLINAMKLNTNAYMDHFTTEKILYTLQGNSHSQPVAGTHSNPSIDRDVARFEKLCESKAKKQS
jgi:hypothetical protein